MRQSCGIRAGFLHSPSHPRPRRLPSWHEFTGGACAAAAGGRVGFCAAAAPATGRAGRTRGRPRGGDRPGVGLVSVGAPAALRAFLVNTLDTARPGQFVFVAPKIDLVDLLELRGEGSAPQLPLLPAGLMVTESFDEAVDLVEREALTRALAASDGQERGTHWEPTFVRVAMTSRYALDVCGWFSISDRSMALPTTSRPPPRPSTPTTASLRCGGGGPVSRSCPAAVLASTATAPDTTKPGNVATPFDALGTGDRGSHTHNDR